MHRVRRRCGGLRRLGSPDCRCSGCQRASRLIDGVPHREIQAGSDKLEVVASFCCLGDMLSVAGGCGLSAAARVESKL